MVERVKRSLMTAHRNWKQKQDVLLLINSKVDFQLFLVLAKIGVSGRLLHLTVVDI